jgi:hypothetical protein
MTPRVSMTMNAPDFNKVLAKVNEHSERTYDAFINGQGLRVASFAVRETEKANAAKLKASLWSLYGGKESAGEGKKIYKNQYGSFSRRASRWSKAGGAKPMVYLLVNAARRARGEKRLAGAEMSRAAKKLVGARVRAVAFIKSGWVWSIRTLSAAVGYSARAGGAASVSGKPKGYAKPARRAINSTVTCEIGNTALIAESAARTGSRKGSPMTIAERGLARARDLTAKDMIAHLAKKLQPVLNKFSAA